MTLMHHGKLFKMQHTPHHLKSLVFLPGSIRTSLMTTTLKFICISRVCTSLIRVNDKNSYKKKQAYQEVKQKVHSSLRKMKESWWSSKAAELQKSANKKDFKAFNERLKRVLGPEEKSTYQVLAFDGETLLSDKREILARWKEHFENVFNSHSVIDKEAIAIIPQPSEIPQLSLEPCLKEVQDAIKQMTLSERHRDGLIPKVYKHGGKKLALKIFELFKSIWKVDRVPQEYKDASNQAAFQKQRREKNHLW